MVPHPNSLKPEYMHVGMYINYDKNMKELMKEISMNVSRTI